MNELLSPSGYFFVALTLCAYALGTMIQRRWRYALLNPIVLAAAGVMVVLTLLDIPNETYQAGCGILSYLLTPPSAWPSPSTNSSRPSKSTFPLYCWGSWQER